MTSDEIIELAIKAGFSLRESFVRTELRHEKDGFAAQFCIDPLERFAELVAAAERTECARHFEVAMRNAVTAEREACAALVEKNADMCGPNTMLCDVLRGNATAIRARGES